MQTKAFVLASLLAVCVLSQADLPFQSTTVTSATAFASTDAPFAAFNGQSAANFKTPYHFWAGVKAKCATAIQWTATSDNENDYNADRLAALLVDAGGVLASCADASTNTNSGAGLTASDQFNRVSFQWIRCHEDVTAWLVRNPTTIGAAWAECIKGGIEAVGYTTTEGLLGQFFRRTYKTYLKADITSAVWADIVKADTDGSTYTNAAYSTCATSCESSQAWAEEASAASAYNGVAQQLHHAKVIEQAKIHCKDTKVGDAAKPSDAFAGTAAVNTCVDNMIMYARHADIKKMKCYQVCANPPSYFAKAKPQFSLDGEVLDKDGEHVHRKRYILERFFKCVKELPVQVTPAIETIPTQNSFIAASTRSHHTASHDGAEESELLSLARGERKWQHCLTYNKHCKTFSDWAMVDFQIEEAIPSAANTCISHCLGSSGYVGGGTFAGNPQGWAASGTVNANTPKQAATVKANACLAAMNADWSAEKTLWEDNFRSNSTILAIGSALALFVALLF